MADLPDSTLERIERAREGDERALAWLHEHYRERLLARIRLMMGGEAQAVAESGDFLQGCFLEVIESLPSAGANDGARFLRWATAIARNNIRDDVRRRRERALESLSASAVRGGGAPSPATELVAREEVARLVEALERLTPEHRRVIELRDLEELPFVEVGARMERSEDAAQKLHTRAMIRLGEQLEGGRVSETSTSLRERAEDLYDEFLAARSGDAPRDLDELAEGDAALARALHAVDERYRRAAAALGDVSATGGGDSADELVEHLATSHERETYRQLEAIARGGMGEIHRVWDAKLRRTLAMKVLPPAPSGRGSSSAGRRRVRRFLEEAEIAGQLEHPGIVPVHDLGLDAEDRLFFTMPLVRGRNLREIVDLVGDGAEGWTLGRALGVVMRVCEAMAYAHSKGVVHRDLKPANVMVGEFGETYVMDWGLAKRVDRPEHADVRLREPSSADTSTEAHASLQTMDGDVVGTPAYMAPEQARGDLARVDAVSDVYSVGAMLYHLLAGEAPYGSDISPVGILDRVRGGAPRGLASLHRRTAPELVAICEKAMARERGARYAGMRELADDLQAYLDSRVVRAYDTGVVENVRKWVARNPAATAAILAVVVGVAAVVAVQRAANLELSASNEELRRADYFNNVALASSAYESLNTVAMRELLDHCDEDLRNWEWHYLDGLSDSSVRTIQAHEPGTAAVVDWLPDHRHLATAGWDRLVKVHDTGGTAPPRVLRGHSGIVDVVEASPDGAWIVSGSRAGELFVWGAVDGTAASRQTLPSGVGALAFSPDGSELAVGMDGVVRLVETASWGMKADLLAPVAAMQDLAFSPSGDRLAAIGRSGGVRVWELPSGAELLALDAHQTFGNAVAFSPDGRWLVSGGGDRAVRLWDARSGEPRRWFFARWGGSSGVAFTSQDDIVTAEFANLRFWDVATGSSLLHLAGHGTSIVDFDVAGDGARIASGDRHGVVKLWSLPPARSRLELAGHTGFLYPLAFAPDARLLASGARDGTVRLWDVESGAALAVLEDDLPWVLSLAFGPGGDRLAAGYRDGVVRVWNVAAQTVERSLNAHSGWVRSVSITAAGDRLLSSGADATAALWDLATGQEVVRFRHGPDPEETWSALDPTGARAATGGWGGRVRVWDLSTGDMHHESEYASTAQALGFSPDGRRLAVGSGSQTVDVLDVESGEWLFAAAGHEFGSQALAFTPDGERIVSSGYDGLVKVWDGRTGRTALTLHADASALAGVAVSPDGRHIAAGGVGRTVFVWSIAAER